MDHSTNKRPLLDSDSGSEADVLDNNYDDDGAEEEPAADQGQHTTRFSQNFPADKYNFTYMIFYLLGMTTLLPWNFFITAEDYWMFKFRNIANETDHHLTPMQKNFTSDFSVASAFPNTLFLILNACIGHRFSLKLRMIGSMLIILALFIMTTVFVEIDTDSWQYGFFAFTLATVVVINIFAAILGGGLFGIAGLFPSEYITAVVSGQALGGIFAALAEIISLTFGASPKITAFIYFIVGNIVLIFSLISYSVMSKTVFFRYFVVDKRKGILTSQSIEDIDNDRKLPEPNFKEVFRKIYLYAFSEWFVFVVTLSVYPAVTVLVQSQYHGNGHLWNDIYFTPVVNYLIFNSGDYLGRILAGVFEAPQNKPQTVLLATLFRALFIPILMMSNTNPHNFLPILINSDIVFIVIMILFSVSNGYIANISLIMAPKAVMQHEKEMASSIMAAMLGLGLAIGSSGSLILVQLV